MTYKPAEEAAREWLVSVLGRHDVTLPSSVADHVGRSLAALLESHASERERAAIQMCSDECVRVEKMYRQLAGDIERAQGPTASLSYRAVANVISTVATDLFNLKPLTPLTTPKDQP